MTKPTYPETVRALSDRIVAAQREIRILDAVAWEDRLGQTFLEQGATGLPEIDLEYYAKRPLRFDPKDKRDELQAIERDVARQLGDLNPLGAMMQRVCREYVDVVRLLEARGTPRFAELSRQLYGSAKDVFHAGDPTLADLGAWMGEALGNIDRAGALARDEPTMSGDEAVRVLQERMDAAFADFGHAVRVAASDSVVADAAAGASTIKLRADARFSARDLRVLEVHEGWVHLGTTLNGSRQPVCSFLSKGPPSATITQEGLAVLMEVTSLASHPQRVRRVTNRIRAIDMAEDGADFQEVFRFFLEGGDSSQTAYQNASRVFRGSLPNAGPFTKDLSYCKGFVQVYHFVQLAVRKGALDRIPLLFCGKVMLQDVPLLAALRAEGLVESPTYLPPPIRDLAALSAWMCFANFFQHLSIGRIEADYAALLG